MWNRNGGTYSSTQHPLLTGQVVTVDEKGGADNMFDKYYIFAEDVRLTKRIMMRDREYVVKL